MADSDESTLLLRVNFALRRAPVYAEINDYDTIRDDILARARKPTRVSFIYRTETTTKKSKNRKTKK